MVTRRRLLSSLAGLPFIGSWFAEAKASPPPVSVLVVVDKEAHSDRSPYFVPSYETTIDGGDWKLHVSQDVAVDYLYFDKHNYVVWPPQLALWYKGRLVAMWHGCDRDDVQRYMAAIRTESGDTVEEVSAAQRRLSECVVAGWVRPAMFIPDQDVLALIEYSSLGRAIRRAASLLAHSAWAPVSVLASDFPADSWAQRRTAAWDWGMAGVQAHVA